MHQEQRRGASDLFSAGGIIVFSAALIGTVVPGFTAWREGVFSAQPGMIPFYSSANPLLWLWTIAYIAFGILCLLIRAPACRERMDETQRTLGVVGVCITALLLCLVSLQAAGEILIAAAALSALSVYHGLRARMLPVAVMGLFYELPSWLRNYGHTTPWVRWFASAHMCPACYQIADLNAVLTFLLLALLWDKALARTQTELADTKVNNNIAERVREDSQHLVETFARWMGESALLAVGFVSFASIFWGLTTHGGESYLFQAIAIHAGWGLTWIVLSLPLFLAWKRWDATHRALIFSTDPTAKDLREALQSFLPFERWKAFGTSLIAGLASLGAFLAPLLQSHDVQQHLPAFIQTLINTQTPSGKQ